MLFKQKIKRAFPQWVKISTLQFKVAVRVSVPIFDTLFMVRFRVSLTSGYGVTLNMSTAVRIQLLTVVWKFSTTNIQSTTNFKKYIKCFFHSPLHRVFNSYVTMDFIRVARTLDSIFFNRNEATKKECSSSMLLFVEKIC